jgi:hypothetical protein
MAVCSKQTLNYQEIPKLALQFPQKRRFPVKTESMLIQPGIARHIHEESYSDRNHQLMNEEWGSCEKLLAYEWGSPSEE